MIRWLAVLTPLLLAACTSPCGPLPGSLPECPPPPDCIDRCTDAECRPVCRFGGCEQCVQGKWVRAYVDCAPGCWAVDGG